MRNSTPRISTRALRLLMSRAAIATGGLLLAAGKAPAQPAPDTLDPIVVTGTRTAARAFNLPMSIDAVSGRDIQDGKARRASTSRRP